MPLSVSVQALLRKVIVTALQEDGVDASVLCIFECDHAEDGAFNRFAGVRAARRRLIQEHQGSLPAVLVVGMPPVPRDGLVALLRWPGGAYLPYGFDRETLCSTARRIIEGAKQPLPAELCPTPADILRATFEVRHWIENRLRNTDLMLSDFRAVARGSVGLHPSYLEPAVAISEEHQAMLDRLLDFEPAIEQFAPGSGGVEVMRRAMAVFVARWDILETARAKCKVDGSGAAGIGEIISQIEGVCAALNEAIEATRQLDCAINVGQTGE